MFSYLHQLNCVGFDFWFLSISVVGQVLSLGQWLFSEGAAMFPWSVRGNMWVVAVSSKL